MRRRLLRSGNAHDRRSRLTRIGFSFEAMRPAPTRHRLMTAPGANLICRMTGASRICRTRRRLMVGPPPIGSAFDYTTGSDHFGPDSAWDPEVIGPFDHQNSAGGSSRPATRSAASAGIASISVAGPRQAWHGHGKGRHVELRFDGVYQTPTCGSTACTSGFHPYGYTSFAYDLTPYLNPVARTCWRSASTTAARPAAGTRARGSTGTRG